MAKGEFNLTPKTFLMIDAMYYHAARQSYDQALKLTNLIDEAEQKLWELEEKWENAEGEYEGETNASLLYEIQERLAIEMENAEYNIGVAYGPYLQAIAVTHILCAAALESHINIRSKELLKGKTLEYFERIPLEAKWLFLPRMLNIEGFNPGEKPYQDFSKLTSIRNKLIHYKRREEPWKTNNSIVPNFLENLGLTEENAAQSLDSVREMVNTLAEQLMEDTPYWLRVNDISYFEFVIK